MTKPITNSVPHSGGTTHLPAPLKECRLFIKELHVQLPLTMMASLSSPHLTSLIEWYRLLASSFQPHPTSTSHASWHAHQSGWTHYLWSYGVDQCGVKVLQCPSPWYLPGQLYSNVWSSVYCSWWNTTNYYSVFVSSCAPRLHCIGHTSMGCYETKQIQVAFFFPEL